jgi:host factor-I protein
MDNENAGIQNEFFNRARKERSLLAVVLADGTTLTGRVRAFDKFTILLDTGSGDQMVFKHAIATVGPAKGAPRGDGDAAGNP